MDLRVGKAARTLYQVTSVNGCRYDCKDAGERGDGSLKSLGQRRLERKTHVSPERQNRACFRSFLVEMEGDFDADLNVDRPAVFQ